jgi:hypothetical protein
MDVRGERRYSVLDVVLQTLTGHLSLKGLCPVKVVPRTIFGGNFFPGSIVVASHCSNIW